MSKRGFENDYAVYQVKEDGEVQPVYEGCGVLAPLHWSREKLGKDKNVGVLITAPLDMDKEMVALAWEDSTTKKDVVGGTVVLLGTSDILPEWW